jgi:hypothetical protein
VDERYEVKRFSDGELFLCRAQAGMTEDRALDEVRRQSTSQTEVQVVHTGRTVKRVELHREY